MTDATSGLLTPGTLDLFSQKTRDKILAASLVLFNQRGFGAVTTAGIAEQAGILEGTLWYHFRAKKRHPVGPHRLVADGVRAGKHQGRFKRS